MIQSVWPVIDRRLIDSISHETISLVIHNRTHGSINRKIVKVERSAKLSSVVIFEKHTRLICVSKYEKLRPCNKGSSEKSIPRTMLLVQNATCSVSGKYSSTFRLSSISPIYRTGINSSGHSFVASRMSKSKPSACDSVSV